MDRLIKIVPFDIDEVRTLKASPITNTRSKIKASDALKLSNFKEIRKAAVDENELKVIKPGLDISALPSYDVIYSQEKLKETIEQINEKLKKYGDARLCLSYENIVKLFNENKEVNQNEQHELYNDDLIIEDELENIEDERKLIA